jgi:murein DD-endopeptidase MepM/ murein hydrolase activator NlpD
MTRALILFLILISSNYNIPQRENAGKKYLIFGSNSLQRIYYATSSNFSSNHDGRKAIDSDKNSSWISEEGKGPHWIEIDFGTKRVMSKIVVYPGEKDNYKTIKYFTLQFLYRDKWFDYALVNLEGRKQVTLLKTFSFTYGTYAKKAEIELGGIDASAFRIFIPEYATSRGYAAIAEIETYVGSNKLRYFDERLLGLCYPIKNGFLPESDHHYPNAPRTYRGGKHVGLDIYYYHTDDSYKPIMVDENTPVLAADEGIVIRADWNYKPMSLAEWSDQSNYYQKNPRTFVMRSFGGRQVWIDHQNGVVTTYNHLSRIDSAIQKGARVGKGEIIGWVGNSGLRGEAAGNKFGMHLHFEIWIDGHYLGYGMKIEDIKRYFTWIFSIHQ